MGFFGFSETEGYGAQPYDGIAEADGMEEGMGQVPAIQTPSPPSLSILDEFKNIFSSSGGILLAVSLMILLYVLLKKK